jgi:hypothetical protein
MPVRYNPRNFCGKFYGRRGEDGAPEVEQASFAIARWPRDADVATIARCILGTLKYEPHAADITVLRQALEGVIKHEAGRERRAI